MRHCWKVFIVAMLLTGAWAQGGKSTETATFGGGCFWCTEAIFQELEGVQAVTSGMMGGREDGLTARQIARGEGGHAEVVQISFDPAVISYSQLLEVFFETHDPTSLNKQGADEGVEYRSVVFYATPEQKTLAEKTIAELTKAQVYAKPIVTEVSPSGAFHASVEEHQNYYTKQSDPEYCQMVITPKVEKFRKVFAELLKKDSPDP